MNYIFFKFVERCIAMSYVQVHDLGTGQSVVFELLERVLEPQQQRRVRGRHERLGPHI